jgi:hypothetical protein
MWRKGQSDAQRETARGILHKAQVTLSLCHSVSLAHARAHTHTHTHKNIQRKEDDKEGVAAANRRLKQQMLQEQSDSELYHEYASDSWAGR